MRTQTIIGAAIAAFLLLAAGASAAPSSQPAQQDPAPCSITSTVVAQPGQTYSFSTTNCGEDARAEHGGFLDRVMSFLFTSVPAPVPNGTDRDRERPLPVPGVPSAATATPEGLRCTAATRGSGRMKEVGIWLDADRDTLVQGLFKVSASGKGSQTFRRTHDRPIQVVKGKSEFASVIDAAFVPEGSEMSGSILMADGEGIECSKGR